MQTPLGALVPSRHSYLQSFLLLGGLLLESLEGRASEDTVQRRWAWPSGLRHCQLGSVCSSEDHFLHSLLLCSVRCCHYVGSAGFAPAWGCPWYLAVKFRRRKKPQISLFSFSCLLLRYRQNLSPHKHCARVHIHSFKLSFSRESLMRSKRSALVEAGAKGQESLIFGSLKCSLPSLLRLQNLKNILKSSSYHSGFINRNGITWKQREASIYSSSYYIIAILKLPEPPLNVCLSV